MSQQTYPFLYKLQGHTTGCYSNVIFLNHHQQFQYDKYANSGNDRNTTTIQCWTMKSCMIIMWNIVDPYKKMVMTMIRPTDYAVWICQIFHYQKMHHNLIIRHAKNAHMQACTFCNISKPIMLLHLNSVCTVIK